MTFKAIVQRIHIWAGLILGLQVFIWILSGVVMSWFHIDLVRGERAMFAGAPPELEAAAYASPGGVIAQTDGATSLELRSFLGKPVYVAQGPFGEALFDAADGEKLSPISEETARAVAKADYVGEGEVERVALLTSPPHEYRGPRPVWRVDYDDALKTRLYISQSTGKVVSRRNAVWRLYDFFWMLHIMDYEERENFNNPLVKAASAISLAFAISGLIMLFLKSSRRILAGDVRMVLRLFSKKAGQAPGK